MVLTVLDISTNFKKSYYYGKIIVTDKFSITNEVIITIKLIITSKVIIANKVIVTNKVIIMKKDIVMNNISRSKFITGCVMKKPLYFSYFNCVLFTLLLLYMILMIFH